MAPVSVAVHSLGAIAPCLPVSARASRSLGKTESQYSRSVQLPRSALNLPCLKTRSIGQQNGLLARQVHLRTVTCSAALAARCSAEQTQTIERQSTTITVAPIQGKSPELDDGGSGFPPRDDDDGGGGGGGGGGNWSGGFWFFGFLALLGLLKDKESEAPSYRSDRR
ncbi:hypothetical protein QJS10_CPB17g00466 [Acorus calamus]|uniref:Uncharacterized protein n=1 Tax=Acorus calamus TaxID=4465 RepID=A0AAV9CTP3_ACOCL|nr:hypothetical protein QJS10_CPB17g00466 [Acorus calamus]